MGTLTEIEAAAERLSPEQMRELFLFLSERLRDSAGVAETAQREEWAQMARASRETWSEENPY